MLESVYGRLGEIRHRAEMVEYRFDQHFERRGDRIVTRASEEVSAPLRVQAKRWRCKLYAVNFLGR
jgi:hypothetical protein